jgi:hypothetical protein
MEVNCVFVHLNVDKEIEGNICCNESNNMSFYVYWAFMTFKNLTKLKQAWYCVFGLGFCCVFSGFAVTLTERKRTL